VGTWWSYRYIQSLNNNTPIVTFWQETANFDPSWAVLAYQVEDMRNHERQALSDAQWRSYVDNLPSREFILDKIVEDLIGSNKEKI
jgi:hypothetical protein